MLLYYQAQLWLGKVELRDHFAGSVKIMSANADRVWICSPEPWLHTNNSFQSFTGGGANRCLKIKCYFVKSLLRGELLSLMRNPARYCLAAVVWL